MDHIISKIEMILLMQKIIIYMYMLMEKYTC